MSEATRQLVVTNIERIWELVASELVAQIKEARNQFLSKLATGDEVVLQVQATGQVRDGEYVQVANWKAQRKDAGEKGMGGKAHTPLDAPGQLELLPREQASPPAAVETPEVDLFELAVKSTRLLGRVSVSLLQRRLGIGYQRALALLQELEAAGVVQSAEDGTLQVIADADGGADDGAGSETEQEMRI